MIAELRARLHAEVAKVVVGQQAAIDAALIALCAGGHVLYEGVPGTAKTLLANAVARSLGLQFRRAQFTPDMLPSDLTGTMTLAAGGQLGELRFREGPIFTNVLLADEINRTPPKTQAALLEAMGEGTVSIDGTTRPLPSPFLVLATQNPIEYEGTYPLPEAQLDRFLMKVDIGYPSASDEVAMLKLRRDGVASATITEVQTVGSAEDIAEARRELTSTAVHDDLVAYIAAVVQATRVVPSVQLGASPRAAVHLLAASKGTARLVGREYVIPDDIVSVAPAVLRHRVLLRPEAAMQQYRPDDAVATAIASVPIPR